MEKKPEKQGNKVSITLRFAVGVYCIYLAYGLLDEFNIVKALENKVSASFGFLYLLIGLTLCIWSCKSYYSYKKNDRDKDESL